MGILGLRTRVTRVFIDGMLCQRLHT
jgi:hypothetical protein